VKNGREQNKRAKKPRRDAESRAGRQAAEQLEQRRVPRAPRKSQPGRYSKTSEDPATFSAANKGLRRVEIFSL
jgi:hypothetical protein